MVINSLAAGDANATTPVQIMLVFLKTNDWHFVPVINVNN